MPTFTPPTEPGVAWGDNDSMEPKHRLMRYYGSVTTGVTVWRDQLGNYHQSQYPYEAGATHTVHNDATTTTTLEPPGLADAQEVYLGGHTYTVTDAQALSLIAAGFGDRINIAPVTLHWQQSDIAKLSLRNMSFSDLIDTPATPTIDSSERGVFQLSAGQPVSSPGRRDWWLHSDIFYTNHAGETTLDPPSYGDLNGGLGQSLPQGGVVIRAQESGGRWRGITLNNNVFFFVPILNVGVWSANLDGTAFLNRQYGFPFPESIPANLFPYSVGWQLTDNTIQVRVWWDGIGKPAWATDLNSSPISKLINLDVDAGSPGDVAANPTPVGGGSAGIVAAHLGTLFTGAYRARRTTFWSLDPGAPT